MDEVLDDTLDDEVDDALDGGMILEPKRVPGVALWIVIELTFAPWTLILAEGGHGTSVSYLKFIKVFS